MLFSYMQHSQQIGLKKCLCVCVCAFVWMTSVLFSFLWCTTADSAASGSSIGGGGGGRIDAQLSHMNNMRMRSVFGWSFFAASFGSQSYRTQTMMDK